MREWIREHELFSFVIACALALLANEISLYKVKKERERERADY